MSCAMMSTGWPFICAYLNAQLDMFVMRKLHLFPVGILVYYNDVHV